MKISLDESSNLVLITAGIDPHQHDPVGAGERGGRTVQESPAERMPKIRIRCLDSRDRTVEWFLPWNLSEQRRARLAAARCGPARA